MLNRARRLGTPGTTRRTPDRVPNRSARRPIPFRRTGARRLLRQAIGLNPAKRRRARRTLRLRGLTYLAGARKIPGRMWDARMKRVPTPIDPQWLAPTVPEPKATVQPGPRHPQPEVQRNMSVSESITDAFAQLARFEASSASEVERLIIEQPEMFATIGDHYSTLADRMVTEMPFDPAVADAVRDLGAAIAAAGQVAEQAHAVMRQAHEADFARTEQPRPGEELWDTGRQ